MDIDVTWQSGSRGLLRYDSIEVGCALGKAGITLDKREGDHATPIGHFPLRFLFFRDDKLSGLNTQLPHQEITEHDGWCDAPDHSHYNQYVRLPFDASHEKLWRDDDLYDLVVILGHNDAPAIPGAGSCIFMHIARGDFEGTEGCIALKKTDFLELLKVLDADSHITISPPATA